MTDYSPYYFALSVFKGIGPQYLSKLIDTFENPKNIFHASTKTLVPLLGEKLTEKFRTFTSSYDPIAQYTSLCKKGIQYVHLESPQYPKLLRSISDPPIGLFVLGTLQVPDLSIAIVGTRIPSFYGEFVAHKFATELATSKIAIISGLAVGIDSIAHEGALDVNGYTIAVLGCGVDMIPSSRAKLYQRIIDADGAVISEFPPGEYSFKGHFVSRNRVVSGISNGVLVVEGTDKSGTLITAGYAANQGKDVFAPPVPINSHLSQAPNILLKQGAKLVTCVEDILEEYDINVSHRTHSQALDGRAGNERIILELLITQPLSTDELCQKTTIPLITILTIISMLEIEGVVRKQGDGKYGLS